MICSFLTLKPLAIPAHICYIEDEADTDTDDHIRREKKKPKYTTNMVRKVKEKVKTLRKLDEDDDFEAGDDDVLSTSSEGKLYLGCMYMGGG